jgi:predicted TIM-barrel fold metal-dependent hydrolase
MWQFLAAGQNYLFRRYLREIVDLVGSQQLMFGTDGPIFEPYITHRQWVEMIHSLQNSDGEPQFTDSEIKAILGENAAKIFNIES